MPDNSLKIFPCLFQGQHPDGRPGCSSFCIEIKAKNKTSALKAARLHGRQNGLRFIEIRNPEQTDEAQKITVTAAEQAGLFDHL